MKMEDPLLVEYVAYKYPHTVKVKRGDASQDQSVMKDGKRVGKRLIISKGVANHGGNRDCGSGIERTDILSILGSPAGYSPP